MARPSDPLIVDAKEPPAPDPEIDGGELVLEQPPSPAMPPPAIPATREVHDEHLLEPFTATAANVLGYPDTPEVLEDSTCCGLANIGNTCYANALLFALSKIYPLRIWLTQHQQHASTDPYHSADACVLCWLAEDIARLTTITVNEPFIPRTVVRRGLWNQSFNNSRQHDAQEAFQTLLTACNAVDDARLQELVALDYHQIKHTTPFWNTFGGIKLETVRCRSCLHISDTYVPYNNLQLGIERLAVQTVEHAINQSLGAEDIEYTCRCGSVNTSAKTTSIIRWPKVLVLHLKRWHWNRLTGLPEKIDTHISFETLLPIGHGTPYSLRSLVVHTGEVGAGHYTALARAQNNFWYNFDDRRTPARVPTDSVLATKPYLLIYER